TINRRDFIFLTGLTGLSALTSPWLKRPSRYGQPQPGEKNITPESWIELNPDHIQWNLKQIRQKVKVPIMAVIKANAYGHGLVEFGKILDQSGIDALMVCELQEAVTLRESSISCPIYNFGPVIPQNTDILIQHNISQFLHSGDIQELSRQAEKRNANTNCHIHIDTGMHRMGFPCENALPVIQMASALKGLSISGISTTLTEDKDFDKVQLQTLQSIYDKAKALSIDLGMRHAASSAGIFESESYFLDMTRPGIVLYGYYPNERTLKEDALSLRPVLSFNSRVVDVKTVEPGESVSYLREYKAKQREKIAVIPVGYSSGYPVSGKAQVLIQGKRYPVLDTITANHMEAKLSLDSSVAPGDQVTMIGTQGNESITADDLASWAGISNYKALIRLNPTIPRRVMH
ncbi:MAG TPA: alanine racemase, partial [Desulfobacteraceae bacterium]|nr:alanine racemase [Desulfobacteraceae bacterium]